jgi:hypothetical protein
MDLSPETSTLFMLIGLEPMHGAQSHRVVPCGEQSQAAMRPLPQ